jgi:hypothetical protein
MPLSCYAGAALATKITKPAGGVVTESGRNPEKSTTESVNSSPTVIGFGRRRR